jgi:hypothetical protein
MYLTLSTKYCIGVTKIMEFDLPNKMQAPGGQLADAAASAVKAFAGSENILANGFGAFTGVKQRVSDFLSDTGFGKALRTMNLLPALIPQLKFQWLAIGEHQLNMIGV